MMERKKRIIAVINIIFVISLIVMPCVALSFTFTSFLESYGNEFRLTILSMLVATTMFSFIATKVAKPSYQSEVVAIAKERDDKGEKVEEQKLKTQISIRKNLEEKQADYKKQNEIWFLELREEPEIITILENFFPLVPSTIFCFCDEYTLFEFLLLSKSKSSIGKKILWSKDADLSKAMSVYFRPKSYVTKTFTIDPVKAFIDGDFEKLVKLLKSKFHYENDYDYVFIALRLLQIGAVSYYSQVFTSEYDTDLSDQSLEECLFRYYKQLVEKDPLADPNISLFTYHMICNDKFGEVSNIDYYNYLDRRTELLGMLIDKKESFDNKIFELKMQRKVSSIRKGYSIQDIDLMSGAEFEQFVAELFIKMGYRANVTQHSSDFGVDIVAEKEGIKVGIQAKCYSTTVSNSAIQEVVAGMKYYDCEKGVVVTNSSFTNAAIKLARVNSIQLWDREVLILKISELFIDS